MHFSAQNLKALALILFMAGLNLFLWSTSTLPLYAIDEGQHYTYAWMLEHGTPLLPVPEPRLAVPSQALEFANITSLVEHYRIVPFSPEEHNYFRTALQQPSQYRSDDVSVDTESIIINQPMFSTYHPPLYYQIVGQLDHSLADFSFLRRIQLLRCLSMLFGLLTLVLVYRIGLKLFKDDANSALSLTALTSLQPQLCYTFSSLTNIAMEIPLACLAVLLCLHVVENKPTILLVMLLGLTLACGLMTKISFLALVPMCLIACFVSVRKDSFSTPKLIGARVILSATMLALPLLLVRNWYKGILGSSHTIVSSYGKTPGAAPINPLTYALHYDWIQNYGAIFATYWGSFAWSEAKFPLPVYALLAIGTLLLFVDFLSSFSKFSRLQKQFFAIAIVGIASLLAFYAALDYRFKSTVNGYFTIRGQYYLPMIAAEMAILLSGCKQLASKLSLRRPCFSFLSVMVLLNLYARIGVVLPRFYGDDWLQYIDFTSVMSAVDPVTLVVANLLFLSAVAYFLICIWKMETAVV